MTDGIGDGEKPSAGLEDPRQLPECPIEVGDVVEHPGCDGGVEGRVVERKILRISDVGVENATSTSQLDHPLRLVEEGDVGAQLCLHPLGKLTLAAAHLEHVSRFERGEHPPDDHRRVLTLDVRPERLPRSQVRLAPVLLLDRGGVRPARHPALFATKTEHPLRTESGSPSSAGKLSAKGDIAIEART